MANKDLEITTDAINIGVVRARMIDHNNGNIVYMEIDPKKADHEMLKKEAKEFWLIYKYKKDEKIQETPTPDLA